jgi:hypothetical protein
VKIRMIFATKSEDGKEDLHANEVREVSADYARQLIAQGRAEPVEPEVVQHRDPVATVHPAPKKRTR